MGSRGEGLHGGMWSLVRALRREVLDVEVKRFSLLRQSRLPEYWFLPSGQILRQSNACSSTGAELQWSLNKPGLLAFSLERFGSMSDHPPFHRPPLKYRDVPLLHTAYFWNMRTESSYLPLKYTCLPFPSQPHRSSSART